MVLPTCMAVQRIVKIRAAQRRTCATTSVGVGAFGALAALVALVAACGDGDDDGSSAAGGPCGGAVCAADQYCNYPPGDCGEGGVVPGNYGVCQERPTSCDTATPREICACDGRSYANACEAARAGVSVGNGEECAGAAPPGTFACGSYFCRSDGEYCQTIEDQHDELFRLPPQSSCKAVAVACAPEPSCACLIEVVKPAGSSDKRECTTAPTCTQDASGNFALRCAGDLY